MSAKKEDLPKDVDSALFTKLMHSVYDAVFITTIQGLIEEANPRAEKMFQTERNRLCGRNIMELISGLQGNVLEKIVSSLNAEQHIIVEALCKRGDGSGFYAEIAINKTDLTAKDQLCFSVRDISPRNEAIQKLRQAQEELIRKEKIQARMDTITTLAHEINNPLQILMSMVEMDQNLRYATPLNRICAVMQELRMDEELKTVDYTKTVKRYAIPPPELEPCGTRHVLVVDDEETLVNFFASVLTSEFPDLQVESARNGAEAVTAFQVRHHAVVILDISMPIMDGEQAFKRISQICKDHGWEMPAVIFCTGYTPPTTIRNAIEEGNLHCYLAKPVTMDSLIHAVQNRLEFFKLTHGT